MYKKVNEIPVFITSKLNQTAENGSRFDLDLNKDLEFDHIKYNIYAKVIQANIWYSFPNILPENFFKFRHNFVDHTIVFNKGLYDISNVNDIIRQYFQANSLAINLFEIKGDDASSKTYISVTDSVSFDMTEQLNIGRTIMGFNSGDYVMATGNIIYSQNVANFNLVTNVLVHSNISSGSYFNDIYSSDILASITPNVSPSELITYEPFNPVASLVSTSRLSNINLYLTDQNNKALDTNGEIFSLLILIEIYEK